MYFQIKALIHYFRPFTAIIFFGAALMFSMNPLALHLSKMHLSKSF